MDAPRLEPEVGKVHRHTPRLFCHSAAWWYSLLWSHRIPYLEVRPGRELQRQLATAVGSCRMREEGLSRLFLEARQLHQELEQLMTRQLLGHAGDGLGANSWQLQCCEPGIMRAPFSKWRARTAQFYTVAGL